jgi:multidrug resistance protein
MSQPYAPLPVPGAKPANRRAMATVLLTVVLDLVGFGIVIPLMPFLAESLHASPEQATWLMACFSIAQFVFAPLWGQLSDRIGRRPVLIVSIGLTALFLGLFASARSLGMLFLFRTLHGAATANISTAQACMADLSAPEDRAKAMGMIGAAFGVGFTIGPFIGGYFASDTDVTLPFWIATGLSVFNFLLALVVLPETRKVENKAHSRVSLIAALNTLKNPRIGPSIGLFFVLIFAFAMMESTFTLFAEHAHGLRPKEVGSLFGLVGIVGIVVQGGLIRPLVARVGERPMVITGLALLALSLFLLPVAPVGPMMYATFCLIAIGQGITSPALNALISKNAPADEQGRVLGSAQSMGALARVFGPIAGGLLFQRVSLGAPFWVAAGILACGTALSVPATARAIKA